MDILSIISVVMATLLFGGYMLYSYLSKRKKMTMLPVEAGPISNAGNKDFTTPIAVNVSGLDTEESLSYFVVRNNCMNPRNIYSGDIIGVQMFDDNFTLKDVKKGDILLIYFDDESFHGHKIRVMEDVQGEAFSTYYYLGEEVKPSTKLHAFSAVRGVVREVNHPLRLVA